MLEASFMVFSNRPFGDRVNLANFLTCIRIAGSVALLKFEPLSESFFIVYLLCGITDVLDGMVARYTHSCDDDFGAKLDSVADLLFYSSMLISLFTQIWEALPNSILIWIGLILLTRLIDYILTAIKFHCFAATHAYLNKLTGFLVFGIPFMVSTSYFAWYAIVGCSVGTYATMQELLQHIIEKN